MDIDENISNAIIKKVKASDALDPMTDNNGKTATYDPENAIDGDYRTAWVEGTDGAGKICSQSCRYEISG